MGVRHLALIVLAGLFTSAGVGCDREPPTTPTCTLSLAPAARTFVAEGGSQTITVTASAETCTWTATANASWVTLTSAATAAGTGSVTYAVAANQGTDSRAATIAVGSETHAIQQARAVPETCTYAVEPAVIGVPSGAASRQIALTTGARCTWEAASSASWIVVTSAPSGVGPAAINFSVEANRRELPRTGTVTIGGQGVVVTQAGEELPGVCDYSVTPVDFSPCMPGGSVVTRITTGERCAWTVSSDASWLAVGSATSGTGSADIRADFSSNFDAPRLGRLLVRWPTETAGQNVRVQQAGCRYAVSRSRIDIVSTGGSATFDVIQQSDPTNCGGATQDRCVWTAVSDVDWTEITSSMPRAGDNPVSFTVRANSNVTRTGHISVRDQQVTVVQAGH